MAQEMKITEMGGDIYSVQSPSGNTYTVKFCGSGDGDPDIVLIWECTCPAYKFGSGTCKHINAVSQFCEAQDA